MNSILTEDFISSFAKLPESVKQRARKSYRLWKQNPHHPSLHFKRVHSTEPIYSVRVARTWRAVGFLEHNTVSWFWIGSHADYDKLLAQW